MQCGKPKDICCVESADNFWLNIVYQLTAILALFLIFSGILSNFINEADFINYWMDSVLTGVFVSYNAYMLISITVIFSIFYVSFFMIQNEVCSGFCVLKTVSNGCEEGVSIGIDICCCKVDITGIQFSTRRCLKKYMPSLRPLRENQTLSWAMEFQKTINLMFFNTFTTVDTNEIPLYMWGSSRLHFDSIVHFCVITHSFLDAFLL